MKDISDLFYEAMNKCKGIRFLQFGKIDDSELSTHGLYLLIYMDELNNSINHLYFDNTDSITAEMFENEIRKKRVYQTSSDFMEL